MPLFATIWPWIGLGACAILILLLVAGDGLQADRRISRWQDMAWLTWLGVAAYLLHQFEEHGIDLFGHSYAFRGEACMVLGFRDAVSCPVPFSYITAVNVVSVWGAGLIAALAAPRRPLIGLSFFAIPFVNLFAHLGPMLMQRHYNPGLLSAVLVFLPLSVWALLVAVRRYGAGMSGVLAVVLGGLIMNGVMIGSLVAYVNGWFSEAVLVGIQIPNTFVPAGLMWLMTRQRVVVPPTPAPASKPRRAPKAVG
ncbi:HXXEE domain-containing protein [Aquabacter sp. CN5-332]|uniref:HXXEE domain-containing protein n=1 Tax=Aquabacter sp. CN5-332 TaxID=3156608 RepID=UPI0032B5ADC0